MWILVWWGFGGFWCYDWVSRWGSFQSCSRLEQLTIWQYRLWSFKSGDTKLERFLLANQHTQRKLLNFENWCNGEVSKSTTIWLSKSIFYVKNHRKTFSIYFSLKNNNPWIWNSITGIALTNNSKPLEQNTAGAAYCPHRPGPMAQSTCSIGTYRTGQNQKITHWKLVLTCLNLFELVETCRNLLKLVKLPKPGKKKVY